MSVNVYRKVQYGGEGCDLYQCLTCKYGWYGKFDYTPINYCLHCGVEFRPPVPIPCRPHNQPAWHYKRYGHEDDNIHAPSYVIPQSKSESVWRVTEAIIDDLADGGLFPFGGAEVLPHFWTAEQVWFHIQSNVRHEYIDLIVRVEKGGRNRMFYVPSKETASGFPQNQPRA